MKCENMKEQLSAYVIGNVSGDEIHGIESHLSECKACRLELEQIKTIWQSLGDLPFEEPASALRSRFYAMLEAEKGNARKKERLSLSIKIEKWIKNWWPARPIYQFSFSLILMLIGLLLGNQMHLGTRQNGELTRLRQEIQDMRQMVTLSLLNQSSSSERLKGVSWSTYIDKPDDNLLNALINTLRSDPSINVRLAAIDALQTFSHLPNVRQELIESLSFQKSPLVQITLIDLVAQMREKRALESLKTLLHDRNIDPAVKQHAEKSIENLI